MSRLERLVQLLDTGTPVVRTTAAEQLAQVQKAHPHELFNLLGRVAPYLKSPQWDTRQAAAKAIGGIVEHVPLFQQADNQDSPQKQLKVESSIKLEEGSPSTIGIPAFDNTLDIAPAKHTSDAKQDVLSFSSFDVITVIKNGRPLLGSAGKEYDWAGTELSSEERLARAKHDVTNRLGLGAEFMEKDFLSAQDVSLPGTSQQSPAPSPSRGLAQIKVPSFNGSSTPEIASPLTPVGEEGLSARQRNMMKRKAKLEGKGVSNKVRVIDVSTSSTDRRISQEGQSLAVPTPVKVEGSGDYFSITPQAQNTSKIVVEHKPLAQSPASLLETATVKDGWLLDGLVEILSIDLFDPRWETRHGAALAMREILRTQASAAGRRQRYDKRTNDLANQTYLDDLACRLCCIFALDRFGDYVSDQVVAPIRETVSQTLAALLKPLNPPSVVATFRALSQLVFQPGLTSKAWEVTHGGMLGMKYLVAIRKDVLMSSPELVDGTFAAVLHALGDQDDDVRAVGAATLVPITSEFVAIRPASVTTLLDVLWACLAELRDDLSASTGSVMDLLAKLCSSNVVLEVMQSRSNQDEAHSFNTLIPRLYPFLRHTITSVRRAVLRALQTFLKVDTSDDQSWLESKFFRLMFQNLLLEQNKEVLAITSELWLDCLAVVQGKESTSALDRFEAFWHSSVTVMMTPIGHGRYSIPLDTSTFIRPSAQPYAQSSTGPTADSSGASAVIRAGRKKKEIKEEATYSHNIDIPMIKGDIELVGLATLLRTRVAAATALGQMLSSWPSERLREDLQRVVQEFNNSSGSSPHYLAAVLVQECAVMQPDKTLFDGMRPGFEAALSQPPAEYYSNLLQLLHIVRAQCQALCNGFMDQGRLPANKIPLLPVICRGDTNAGPHAFGLNHAESLVGEDFDRLRRSMGSSFKGLVARSLEDSRQSVIVAIQALNDAKTAEDIRINACNGAALVAMGQLPKKLNPIIKALMDSIKTEDDEFMQQRSAEALASLVELCSAVGRASASDKLIRNLCAFLCVDTSETPEFHRYANLTSAIYSLRRENELETSIEDQTHERETRDAKIKHRGAQLALVGMAHRFHEKLFQYTPKLSECIFGHLQKLFGPQAEACNLRTAQDSTGQNVIDGICVLGALVNDFDRLLLKTVFDAMHLIVHAIHSEFATIRHVAARTFAQICKADATQGMQVAITDLLPMLGDAGSLVKRQGAIEAVHMLVRILDVAILPYVIFLIVPVLGRMSDSNNDVRIIATTTFASLVKLVPLESGIPDPVGLSQELLAGRDQERKFIQQMLDGSKVDAFEIPVAIKADLRSYQQDGVNWLAFLNRYQLHGILCDDMGLGKTLQTICIVASDHHIRQQKHKQTQLEEYRPLPSLVICPPSLTGHWQHEMMTYAPFLRSMSYVGFPAERKLARADLAKADVIITSYDIARNDIEYLSKKDFNYCVLDEGHIIKNSKAKLTQAVKLVKANHRLILSGTPIQNNVLELWSLFDFLMPGFLGSEKSFHERYAKPIANSRDSKSSSREQEAGALALEALHKQVLPFLLRRLKEEVLADLPPKIIQDYYCDLSRLQKTLYNDFTTSQASTVAVEVGDSKKEAKSHVFQALQYMRKLCNHPSLVLNPRHPKYEQTVEDLRGRGQSLEDVEHAPKLLALRDLLLDCGIGNSPTELPSRSLATTLSSNVVNQHRALIFCQIKDMLDMVEKDVLKALLPTVSYMRLDGTTDPRKRQSIVQEFNADPSIDVLLLTTHVGGLGLNLTGADTVIFVEHDWNPMKDLQAMDRAHRIGQKKTVNVYRLITRGTLEEKIMGLQKFKINIASTIVNQQNSGLATMATDQILDLFNVESSTEQHTQENEGGIDSQGNLIKKGQKSIFDDLDALHDEDEYADFDVDSFVQTL